MSNTPRIIVAIAATLIVLTGAFAFYSIYLLSQGKGPGGVVTDSAISVGGPFALVDNTGRNVTEADYAGRAHLIFFGFTSCPDICPTKLSEATLVLNELGYHASRLDVLFISVDPERDTPDVLSAYVSNFHPQITGLTGTPDEIARVAREFRAFYRKVPLDGGDYTIDHSTVVYLFDRDNAFVGPVSLDRDPAEVAAQLRPYL